jgi:hypothetical protein
MTLQKKASPEGMKIPCSMRSDSFFTGKETANGDRNDFLKPLLKQGQNNRRKSHHERFKH